MVVEDTVDGSPVFLELGDNVSAESRRRVWLYEALSIDDEGEKADGAVH